MALYDDGGMVWSGSPETYDRAEAARREWFDEQYRLLVESDADLRMAPSVAPAYSTHIEVLEAMADIRDRLHELAADTAEALDGGMAWLSRATFTAAAKALMDADDPREAWTTDWFYEQSKDLYWRAARLQRIAFLFEQYGRFAQNLAVDEWKRTTHEEDD
tara:strand:- start:24 stop:506 length:483 start_codon:yes stop_codon:yes gene_type:complete